MQKEILRALQCYVKQSCEIPGGQETNVLLVSKEPKLAMSCTIKQHRTALFRLLPHSARQASLQESGQHLLAALQTGLLTTRTFGLDLSSSSSRTSPKSRQRGLNWISQAWQLCATILSCIGVWRRPQALAVGRRWAFTWPPCHAARQEHVKADKEVSLEAVKRLPDLRLCSRQRHSNWQELKLSWLSERHGV